LTVRFEEYKPAHHFGRIRDFLVHTYLASEKPINWGLERWNFVRYFAAPRAGAYGLADAGPEHSEKAIRFWEEHIGVWENSENEIVGVVNPEYPRLGDAFFQRHPQYTFLLDEMVEYAEQTLADREKNTLRICIYEHDEPFQAVVQSRGYRKDAEPPGYASEFVIGGLPEPQLPPGFVVLSMADQNNIELRRILVGRAFNHTDPSEWPTAYTYEELQRAPDYRKDLDLYVVGPDGEYVSCCIVWYDEHNQIGYFEPVGTHPDFRRRGFGREVVMEGIRRIADLGARAAYVGSGKPFYEAIGFLKKYMTFTWTREF
jgi:GNAT superfamily N-acetyltransferase